MDLEGIIYAYWAKNCFESGRDPGVQFVPRLPFFDADDGDFW